jgi:hypothetical protein
MPADFDKRGKKRQIVGWRRKKLPNGRYLQIAITKQPGPKGGHTIAYMQKGPQGNVYPATETTPTTTRRVRITKAHGRTVKVKRKRG